MVYEMSGAEVGQAIGMWLRERGIVPKEGDTFQWLLTEMPNGVDVALRVTTKDPSPPR